MLRKRKAQIPHNSGIQLRVSFQKAQRQPPRSRAACSHGVGHGGCQQRQRSLQRLCVAHPAHARRAFSPNHALHGTHQLQQAFAAASCRRDDRYAQPLLQQGRIHFHAFAPRLVHQVHTQYHIIRNFHCLQRQIQIAFQAGGVAHHHNGVCTAKADEVPRHRFLRGMCHQRIAARDIYQHAAPAARLAVSLRAGHRFAGPVARVLVHTRQLVEHR